MFLVSKVGLLHLHWSWDLTDKYILIVYLKRAIVHFSDFGHSLVSTILGGALVVLLRALSHIDDIWYRVVIIIYIWVAPLRIDFLILGTGPHLRILVTGCGGRHKVAQDVLIVTHLLVLGRSGTGNLKHDVPATFIDGLEALFIHAFRNI